ncbi:MAG: hypothetical protein A2Z95_06060 [Gallionellales bacterium GWA2_60_18]|nr:MAG: hypothetical protein A2Z95_06060 [Gallionellales bacterium GWA2_60_18]
MTKSRGIRGPRHRWTQLQIEALRARYPHEKTEKIAAALCIPLCKVYRKASELGLKKTPEYLATPDAQRLGRGDNVGAAFRFAKGHVPANKGVKGVSYPGMVATQFKTGQHPYSWRPIGSVRTSKEGDLQVKLRDTGVTRRDYVPVHHLVWELHHGAIPEGYRITFRDGDKTHIAIENLEAVSVADMMKRNTIHNLPEELKEVLQLKGALNRRITCHERNRNQ